MPVPGLCCRAASAVDFDGASAYAPSLSSARAASLSARRGAIDRSGWVWNGRATVTRVLGLAAMAADCPTLRIDMGLSGRVARMVLLLACDLPSPKKIVPATRSVKPTASRTFTCPRFIRFSPLAEADLPPEHSPDSHTNHDLGQGASESGIQRRPTAN